jgi:hypothetical protein
LSLHRKAVGKTPGPFISPHLFPLFIEQQLHDLRHAVEALFREQLELLGRQYDSLGGSWLVS